MSSEFYGWIPTNRGKLERSLIGKQDFLESFIISEDESDSLYKVEINLNFMNDSYLLDGYVKNRHKNIETIATIEIENDLNGNIVYKNGNDKAKVEFTLEKNGKIEFYNYTENDFLDLKTIQQTMFMLVKLFVHRDNHHHQKVDTALKTYDTFDVFNISNDILTHIKLLESNAKKNKECESQLKNNNALEEAEGYLAYLKTFYILFKKDTNKDAYKEFNNKLKNNLKLSKNILLSMKKNINKRKNKEKQIKGLYSAIFTFIGLFISVNLLLNGFYGSMMELPLNRWDTMGISFIVILFSFYFYIKCNLKSYIYYSSYDLFEIFNFIKYSNLSDLNIKGKILKLTPMLIGLPIFIWYVIDYSNN